MPNTNTTCSTCKYWNNRSGPIRPTIAQPGNTIYIPPAAGYCTLNAPTNQVGALRWPVTLPIDSCGEYVSNQTS